MPLYEYQCKQCGHRFEKIKKFSDEPEKVCPKCGGEVSQVLSAPAVQFKGAGWYVTDYAKKGGGTKSTSDTPASGTEKKSESPSETKPSTPPASTPSTDKKS